MSPNADSAAHVVQLALTPAFLLTGIASLLNVFTQRLARISDQVSRLAAEPTQRPRQLARLRLRSRLLDAAVLLAAIAGALTCCAALTLFLCALRSGGGGTVLFALFGGALVVPKKRGHGSLTDPLADNRLLLGPAKLRSFVHSLHQLSNRC